MSTTTARLLALLSLLQTGRAWPGPELAARLGITARTVRRDIERLRDLGYPVDATIGVLGGYRLAAGTAMPPLLLDDEEAVAIAVGMRAAAGDPIRGIEVAALNALLKLEQVLPSRLQHRVRALSSAIVPLPSISAAGVSSVDPETLTVLARAIADGERLRFEYQAYDRSKSHRTVEPYRVVVNGRRWYLVAWDTDRAAWRIFRVDRLREPRLMHGRFPRREPPAVDAASYVASKLTGLAPTYRAVATLHAPIESVATALVGGAVGLVPVGRNRCRYTSEADTLPWLAFQLMRLGCEFRIHEPPELLDYMRAMAARIARATGD